MKRIHATLAVLASLTVLAVPLVAHADVNNFIVTDFSAEYTLSRSDPQGALAIKEHITVDFTDNNHGIERALPEKYNGQDQHIKVSKVTLDGASENYTTYTSNGNEVLRIGNANATVTGTHQYEVDYSVQNVIRFTADHDELDWNTNGTGWKQPFEAVKATLHMSAALASQMSGMACYTGVQGSGASDCTVTTQDGVTTFTSLRNLQIGENMTFSANFPLATFAKPSAADWWHDHATQVLQIALPPLVAIAVAYPYWRKNGKDLKGRGTIVPEYEPPTGIRAAEADVINNYKLGTNAISATIIDLAIRKYLKIIEGQSDGVLGLGKHKTYTLQRLVAPTNDTLKPYETTVYAALFPSGDTTLITDLKTTFYITAKQLQKDIPANLTAEEYFSANPRKIGTAITGIATALFILGWIIFGADWSLAVGIIVAAAILGFFASIMPRRTQKGVDAKDDLAGLKLYMNVAEKDRIAMLQSVDARYAPQPAAPQQTVDLFEKLLPFAMVMGVEKTWAKQFENIYTSPPDWYTGNWTAFNAGYLVGSLNESMSAMNTAFAAPSSSGAGSGGGFSGGGGGGGGGGGW